MYQWPYAKKKPHHGDAHAHSVGMHDIIARKLGNVGFFSVSVIDCFCKFRIVLAAGRR